MGDWRGLLYYRTECVRTTWTLRIAVIALGVVLVIATRTVWTRQIARSLVCVRNVAASDAALIENYDPDYLLFERVEALEKAGIAPWALVPVEASPSPGVPNPVSRGVAELMARQARMEHWKIVPIAHTEPISLNAALQLRDELTKERVKSVLVVAPGFRSRRSALVYGRVFSDAGIHVRCEPVFGRTTPEQWPETWHGIQNVAQEFLKLQYYRFYVLPFVLHASGRSA